MRYLKFIACGRVYHATASGNVDIIIVIPYLITVEQSFINTYHKKNDLKNSINRTEG